MKKKIAALFILLTLFFSAGVATASVDEYTPESVVGSVYKIAAIKGGVPQWHGSGWKISEGVLMTAGHVCDTEGEDGFKFRAISRWNQEYPLAVVKFSRDPDVCIMHAPYLPGEALNRLVFAPPKYGSDLWYSGAPHGIFGDGTVPFARGYYIGGDRMMIAGYPGASGSIVYNRSGIVGILVRGWRGTHLIEFENAYEIWRFLKE